MADTLHSSPAHRRSDGAPLSARRGVAALARLDRLSLTAWRDLAACSAEPNAYNLPEWVLAANDEADAPALTATDDGGRLIGIIPVMPLWRAYRIPLPALVSADPFHSLGAPLLDRDQADQAAAKLIGQARDAGAHALVLRYLTLDGATAQAFGRVAAQEGLRPRILRSWSRACLDARCDVPLAQRGIRAKKLKELRRLRNRLGECGDVTFAIAHTGDDVAAAFDHFLELEASGWKGRRGSALGQQPALANRIRRAVVALAAQGQCEIATLAVDAAPVAAGVVLRHLDRAFFFKLGIDERFARFSPGVQLALELTRHLCLDPHIATADSTARAGHPMIDHLWRERLLIGDMLIPLRRNDPLLPAIEGSLRGYHATRALAQRWLKR